MAIKYHQNGIGNEYGADHHLTNNWNPDKDYGNEYVNVYFRMETKGYEYPSYSFTEEDRKAFDLEVTEVFTSLGWKCEEKAYGGMEAAKGSWNYIRNGIEEMNDDSRCGKALDDFKLRVLKAKDGNDSI